MGIQDRTAARQSRKSIEQDRFNFIAGETSSARRNFCLLGGCVMRPCVFRAEDLLRSFRLISPPFLCGEKAHARAEPFVVARGLTGILECRVAAGPVPARTHLALHLGRTDHSAATSGARFCVLYFACHSSSLSVSPQAPFASLGEFSALSVASAR